MDQEWKKQNQLADPHAQSPQPPKTVPAAVAEAALPSVSPAPQPISTPPDTLAGQTGTNVYDQYNPGVVPKRKIVVTVIVLALLAIPGGIGAYAFLGKKPPQKVDNQAPAATPAKPQPNTTQPVLENKQPAVPISWKTIDTKLGFTVKAPADWSGSNSIPTSSTFDNFEAKTIVIGKSQTNSTNAYGSYVSADGNFVSVGTQSLTDSKSQVEFEKEITDVNKVAETLAGFGITKDKIKLTSKKINVNGKEWLEVDAEIPDQLSKTLYFWVNDHAVTLSVLSSKQTQLDKLSSDYLFPIAASLQIK